jgi:hypothetical protein
MKKSRKIFSGIIIATVACVAISLIYFAISDYYSKEKTLNRMFKLRAEMKLEEYYECFDIPEKSKNITNSLDSFLEAAEQNSWGVIDSYKISQKNHKTYTIKYGDTVETIELVKQDRKALLFFDTYKISIDSVTSPVLYISPIKASQIKIDGTLLLPSDAVNEEDIAEAYGKYYGELNISLDHPSNIPYVELYDEYFDNYCFVNPFFREYKIELTTEYSMPFTTTLTPSEAPYILNQLELSAESEQQIKEISESFIQKYYYAAQDGESFDAILPLLAKNENTIEFLRNDYEDMCKFFTHGQETDGIIDICFLEATSSISRPTIYDSNQHEFISTVTLRYSYNYSSYNGMTDEYEQFRDLFDETTFDIRCIFEDGRWIVSSVPNTAINIHLL